MPPITTEPKREIIDDFADEIRARMTEGPTPAEDVIDFRNEKADRKTRAIMLVPIGLLRYRRDNGRIASDVINYEKENGPLSETDVVAQKTLEGFLEAKDPEKTEILMRSIEHQGQSEAAIITCDGFLINGNRRKMVLEMLRRKHPARTEFDTMKVVILPGKKDPGGPPTILEIEKIENRYQLQSEGKAEYYGFDRALSIKRKIQHGFSLEAQLRDDPRYANADEKEIKRAVKDYENDLLKPLECVDRYLQLFGREKLYASVSGGPNDKEGRWQAFIDYSNAYHRCLASEKWRAENDVPDDDIGAIEDAAFKLIRLRELKDLPKVHAVMRKLPKLVGTKAARKDLIKISDEVDAVLPKQERYDEEGNPLSPEAIDRKWVNTNKQTLLHRLRTAWKTQEFAREMETPLALLEAALAKLNHDEMDTKKIGLRDYDKARRLASDVQARAKVIEHEIYNAIKALEPYEKKKK